MVHPREDYFAISDRAILRGTKAKQGLMLEMEQDFNHGEKMRRLGVCGQGDKS